MNRVYRYRIYPTKAQALALWCILRLARELYNAALEERRESYKKTGKSPSEYDQHGSIKDIRELRPEFKDIHTHILQDAITRVRKAFKDFFQRRKEGKRGGYPRFKSKDRYTSFTLKDAGNNNGVALVAGDKRLRIHGVGKVKIKYHRPYKGTLKQVTVSQEPNGEWYACFSCVDVPKKLLPVSEASVGIDVGIKTFAVFSDDRPDVENPRLLERAQARVRKAQRKVSRRKRGSNRRKKAVKLLAKQHGHIANARLDFHHRTARAIIEDYGVISIEKLNVAGLTGGMLARPMSDVGVGQFFLILTDKAEEAGRELIEVDPNGTSQDCSECGDPVYKTLSERVHKCPCGYVADRDKNAARNIERRGQRLRREAAACEPL